MLGPFNVSATSVIPENTWYKLLSNYSSSCSSKGEILIGFLTKNPHAVLLEMELKKNAH